MSVLLLFLILVLALVGGAVIFSLLVLLRRGPAGPYLSLALLLLVLAVGVWTTTLRNLPPTP